MDVLRFVIRRFLIAIPVLVISSILVFVMAANSGDPLSNLKANPKVSKATLQAEALKLHLNKSIFERYEIWATHFIRGDFGQQNLGGAVRPLLFQRLGVTLRMILLATLFAIVLAIVLGVVSAVRQYTALDYATTFSSFLFYSIPVFWLAGLLKIIGIQINEKLNHTYFYTLGDTSPGLAGGFWSHIGNTLGHLYLPVIALTLVSLASWSRFQRASMLDVLNSDYVRLARAKGLRPMRVLVRHALRNALIPLTTVVAIDFASLFGGAIGTEKVFAWKGMGDLLVTAVTQVDLNTTLAWLMVTAVIVVVFNLLADILYGVLDPRIRA